MTTLLSEFKEAKEATTTTTEKKKRKKKGTEFSRTVRTMSKNKGLSVVDKKKRICPQTSFYSVTSRERERRKL